MNHILENRIVKTEALIASIVFLWGALTFWIGHENLFENAPSLAFGALILSIQLTLGYLYFMNNRIHDFFNSLTLSSITVLHTWRFFAAWAFIEYSDQLPKIFVLNAAYGDIIAGSLALSVFIFGRTKLAFYIFNIVGLLDFVVAVGTGLTVSLLNLQSTHLLRELPLIIIPLFGVPISGLTHLVSLDRLIKSKNIALFERMN